MELRVISAINFMYAEFLSTVALSERAFRNGRPLYKDSIELILVLCARDHVCLALRCPE